MGGISSGLWWWLFCHKDATMIYMTKNFLLRLFYLKKPSWAERYFIGVVMTAALLAMTISLTIGLAQSVWFDEAYSILVAKHPDPNCPSQASAFPSTRFLARRSKVRSSRHP